VATALKLTEADFSPIVWQGGVYKDKRYGIPLDAHSLGMYYNKAVLRKAGLDPEKPPQTGDDYLAALEQIKGKANVQGHWMTPFPFTGTFQFESLLWQFGGDMFDKDNTKATWDSDAGVKALTWMVDLVKKGYSPKNVGQDADYISLKNSKNAMNWQGIWQVDDARSQKAKIATAPLPKIGTQKGVWGNSHQFVLPKNGSSDPNKQAAARFFIHWFTSNEAEWAKSAKVPAETELAKSTAFTQGLSYLKSFADDVPAVHFPPAVAGIGDAAAKLYDAVQAAVLMKKSPESALSTSAKQASQIMADNKKKYG
jgi:multiple sugar transport system substrate-binding protein